MVGNWLCGLGGWVDDYLAVKVKGWFYARVMRTRWLQRVNVNVVARGI
jgi:hypothetical protein